MVMEPRCCTAAYLSVLPFLRRGVQGVANVWRHLFVTSQTLPRPSQTTVVDWIYWIWSFLGSVPLQHLPLLLHSALLVPIKGLG